MDSAYEQTTELLKGIKRPSAIFYYSDSMAMAGLRAAADLGVKVPEELSIMGYDDIPLTSYSVPWLTSVRQDSGVMGKYIAGQTVSLIESGGMKIDMSRRTLPVDLVVRESTGTAP